VADTIVAFAGLNALLERQKPEDMYGAIKAVRLNYDVPFMHFENT